MDLNALLNGVATQGPYAAMFIWLFFYTMKKHDEREKTMRNQLDQTIPLLTDLTHAIKDIVTRLESIETKIEKVEDIIHDK